MRTQCELAVWIQIGHLLRILKNKIGVAAYVLEIHDMRLIVLPIVRKSLMRERETSLLRRADKDIKITVTIPVTEFYLRAALIAKRSVVCRRSIM